MFYLRKSNPSIALWWNKDRGTRYGLNQHNYITNGQYIQSYRIGGFCLDIVRPTEFTDVAQLMRAKGKMH